MTTASRHSLRLLIPPSVTGTTTAGGAGHEGRAQQLEKYFGRALGKLVEVSVSPSYEALAKDILADKAELAWAPPFVCARLEAMGVRVVGRGVRNGISTYRAALVCRADAALTEDKLNGTTAAWVDRDSVAGYILPLAHLRAKGLEPAKVFFAQEFLGSYTAALNAVLAGKADVSSIFAHGAPDKLDTGLEEVIPGRARELKVIAVTDEVPNDGVAVAMGANPSVAAAVEKALLSMHETPEGERVLHDVFNVEKFETAPRLGYRALYRVALASL